MRVLYLKSKKATTFAEACLTLSPRVFVWNGEELYIDLTPTLAYFKGEAGWIAKFEKLRESFKESSPYLLTDRFEWAKTFYEPMEAGSGALVIPPDQSKSLLWQLPIERLMAVGDPALLSAQRQDRLYLVSFMRRVGLNRIADFARLDATAISRRFGKLGLILHEWIEGQREVALPPFTPTEPIREFVEAEDLISKEALLLRLRPSMDRIQARLTGRGEGAKAIKISFHFDGGATQHEMADFHEPTRDVERLMKPLQNYLSQPRWEAPLTFLELEVARSAAFHTGQLSLFDLTENRMADLAVYVQALRGRLGSGAVGFAELRESYLPERSWKKVWPPPKKERATRPFLGTRPPILYSPPRPYAFNRNAKLTPSENLASEWWEETGAYRRYFLAHTHYGNRLWIFWDCQKQEWFLQGAFD